MTFNENRIQKNGKHTEFSENTAGKLSKITIYN